MLALGPRRCCCHGAATTRRTAATAARRVSRESALVPQLLRRPYSSSACTESTAVPSAPNREHTNPFLRLAAKTQPLLKRHKQPQQQQQQPGSDGAATSASTETTATTASTPSASSSSAASSPRDSPSLESDGSDLPCPHELLSRLAKHPLEHVVDATVAEHLIVSLEAVLSRLDSPVIDVPLPSEGEDPRIVLIGDTHGQLLDVLHIFAQNGAPSRSVVYVFNGDIADRGWYAVEIWLLLAAFKLRCPESVHILRGNHENEQMNIRPLCKGGGFAEEVMEKYGLPLRQAFRRLFVLLPLFAVVAEEAFVVHGGLFRSAGVTLDRLRALRPPTWRRSYPDPGKHTLWTEDEAIVFDAQWADPHDGSGSSRPSRRGGPAMTFGADVTRQFLNEADLSLCIRSHRAPQTLRGFELHHGGRLMTVFSASDYGGVVGNRGAVAVFRPPGEVSPLPPPAAAEATPSSPSSSSSASTTTSTTSTMSTTAASSGAGASPAAGLPGAPGAAAAPGAAGAAAAQKPPISAAVARKLGGRPVRPPALPLEPLDVGGLDAPPPLRRSRLTLVEHELKRGVPWSGAQTRFDFAPTCGPSTSAEAASPSVATAKEARR